jgi:hypothetical protein
VTISNGICRRKKLFFPGQDNNIHKRGLAEIGFGLFSARLSGGIVRARIGLLISWVLVASKFSPNHRAAGGWHNPVISPLKMRPIKTLIVLSLICFLTVASTIVEDVSKTKTFDGDRITDYTFEYKQGKDIFKLFYTFDKPSNSAGIKYDPDRRFTRFDELKPILLKLVQKAEAHAPGKLKYFLTFEYLNCDDLYIQSMKAFHEQQQWEAYLFESKKKWIAPPYAFIRGRIIEEGIFSGLIPLFSEIGYDVQFSSYEKLAVRKAGDFDFYDDVKTPGIKPDDTFPEPLILYFSLKPKK